MKAIIIALFATIFALLFLNIPFVQAIENPIFRPKVWHLFAFDLFIGVLTYLLARACLTP